MDMLHLHSISMYFPEKKQLHCFPQISDRLSPLSDGSAPFWILTLSPLFASFEHVPAIQVVRSRKGCKKGFCCNTAIVEVGARWMFPKIVGFPPKSSILIGFSIINHPFWGTPIFGNTHVIAIGHYWTLN